MKEVFTAKSVEEAKAMAARSFGVSEELISFNVIEEPKKSLFGKVKGDAKVEAEFVETKFTLSERYIRKILEASGVENVKVEVTETENGADVEIDGDGIDVFIGRKGEVLDSLQYLTSLACNKIDRDLFRLSIDSNGFREKRKEQLEELARKMAANVRKNGRTSALEPMNPYERRIIHAVVSEMEGVTSRSVGEEPYRKVLISSTERRPYSGRRDQRGGRSGGRRGGQRTQKSFDITTSFEKEYKKPKPEDSMTNAGLYSKIEF